MTGPSSIIIQATQATTDATLVNTNNHCPRVIVQVVVSILSFLASLLVSISVAGGGKGNKNEDANTETNSGGGGLGLLFKNPYRRIIFGLCLADMFLSYSLAIGPLAVPKHEVFSPWGKGNTMSCNFAGLSLGAGSIMSPMYTTFLCYYYKRKLSDRRDSIPKTREVAIHSCIWCLTIIVLSVSLYTGSINPAPSGAHCGPVLSPTGCNAHPEIFGECKNVESVTTINGIVFGIFLISLVFIVIFMTFVTIHVCRESKKYQSISGAQLRSSTSTPPEDQEQEEEERRSFALREKAERLRRLYLTTALTQAFLFVIAFVVTNATYVYVTAFSVMRKKLTIAEMNPVIYYGGTVLYCSTGIINILVFTRPGIVFLRQEKPEYSFCTLLYLILRNGGEVPKHLLKSENDQDQAEQIDSVAYGVEGIFIPSGIESSEDCRFVSHEMSAKSSDQQESSVISKKIGTKLKQEEYEWYNCFPLQLPSSSDGM
ncbi:predicted protein [Chaetoceros tenuissimus]|uniref:G-protein coupled receptors family 1 profile domain-containing protein n=1 Tax=Chaetoceros tenuissimus TaxID=426638 RepID=A0AAD3HAB6_9STRA|nr:predicted protein [Chaetoceros tenuissimus]